MNTKKNTEELFAQIMDAKIHGKPINFFSLDFSDHTEEEELQFMIKLYQEEWHNYHDNFSHIFQQLREPKLIPHLVKVAKNTNLEQSEEGTIARVCCYALSYIGTEEAKNALIELSNFNIKEIRIWASQHLNQWNDLSKFRGKRIAKTGGNIILTETLNDFKLRNNPNNISLNQLYNEDSIIVFTLLNKKIAITYNREKQTSVVPKIITTFSSYKKILEVMNYKKLKNQKIIAIWIKKEYINSITKTNNIFKATRLIHKEKTKFSILPDLEIEYLKLELKDSIFSKNKRKINYLSDISDFYNKQINYIHRNQIMKLRLPLEQLIN